MVPPCVGTPAGEVIAAGHSGRGGTATAGGHAVAAACPGARPRAMASPTRKCLVRLLVTLPTLKRLGFSVGVATGRAISAGSRRLRARRLPKQTLQRYLSLDPTPPTLHKIPQLWWGAARPGGDAPCQANNGLRFTCGPFPHNRQHMILLRCQCERLMPHFPGSYWHLP